MADPELADRYRAAWKALPAAHRKTLASDAARGLRGRNRKDAAYMLWWAGRELGRGPWPGLKIAGAVIAVVVVIQVVFLRVGIGEVLAGLGSSALPILALIPVAAWYFRRPKLQRSMQLNATMLAGRTFDRPPQIDEAEQLLARADRKGLLQQPDPVPEV